MHTPSADAERISASGIEHKQAQESLQESLHQLLSPRSTKRKRSESCGHLTSHKRACLTVSPQQSDTASVKKWLDELPATPEPPITSQTIDNMSLPPASKRSRSSDQLGRRSSLLGDGSESSVLSREGKYLAYKDVNYPAVLKIKNSFMENSDLGLTAEELSLCCRLMSEEQPVLKDSLFDCTPLDKVQTAVDRSEGRVYISLHPLLVPSAVELFLRGYREFRDLIEGYNEPWIKAIPFCGPRPQPDHTVGFSSSSFTEVQRRKLLIEQSSKSLYTAREDIYFPFLTSEVKCGLQALDLADRPNAHSMTVAMIGIVALARKAGCAMDVHRRVLGFSISHDGRTARLYAHYPEINGDTTAYYRHSISEFCYWSENGKDKWKCYRFVFNVYMRFAPLQLERIKRMIDLLNDPSNRLEGSEPVEDSGLSSGASSAVESLYSQPRRVQGAGLNAEFRTIIQNLQNQLQEHRKEAAQQRQEAEQRLAGAEQRQREAEQRIEQQRKESEQQRQESEQQRQESEQQRQEQRQLIQALQNQIGQLNALSQP